MFSFSQKLIFFDAFFFVRSVDYDSRKEWLVNFGDRVPLSKIFLVTLSIHGKGRE